jgi:endonuclease YncB( thermonuclease family)
LLHLLAAGNGMADTLQLNGTTYRLDGIDAPERDQVCLAEGSMMWPCGAEARDRLTEHIGTREVRCDDKGADTVHRERRIGICTVEGDDSTMNQWLVREGLALNFDPYARGRYQRDQGDARENNRGLWRASWHRGTFGTSIALGLSQPPAPGEIVVFVGRGRCR